MHFDNREVVRAIVVGAVAGIEFGGVGVKIRITAQSRRTSISKDFR